MVIYQNKYTIGGNEPTGGIEDGWFVYSHGSYYGEVPRKKLIDETGHNIDQNGNQVSEEGDNPYLSEFNKIWRPKDETDNPSLPVIIQPSTSNQGK